MQVIGCQVGIALSHLDTGMTEQFADLKKWCAIHHQATREGMAKVMDMKIIYPCPSTSGSEGLSHIIDPVSDLGSGG